MHETLRPDVGVLVIDDDARVQHDVVSALAPRFTVHVASSGEEGLDQYDRFRSDVVLLDVMLPQMSGLAVLRALKRIRPDLPVIMMTAYAEVQTAVQAIKLGAIDYLQKPIDPAVVHREIEQAVARASHNQEPVRATIVGRSAAMKRIWRLVERFGPTDIPILLQGETGTGKGLIAEAIHRVSKRMRAPFVAIDCATIPGDLAESELFGYEDGAFTGAGKKKRGRVSFADRGTLFLDEIGTLALGTQAKLLTLIERQHFLPLGARSFQPTQLDVRFISATNVPLHTAVEAGSFRADLFHRLNGIIIDLPPLRERNEDIELLAHYFAAEFGVRHGKPDLAIGQDALQAMQQYSWPGNVRELQRVLSAAVVLATDAVTAEDLPEYIRRGRPSPESQIEEPDAAVEEAPPVVELSAGINLREIKEWAGRDAQKRVILELQKHTNISRQDLARLLGVDPKTLRARLKELSLPSRATRR